MPTSLLDVGVEEGLVFGFGEIDPLIALDHVHVTELPTLDRIVGALLKTDLLLLFATENQYLRTMIPERTSIRSNSGQERRNSRYSASVQNPITFSTPDRLYQLRSKMTISPAAGRCET